MPFTSNIRALRKAMGLNQKELAKLLGVSKNTVGSWENDDSKTIKLYQFTKLCEALECEHTTFLIGEEDLECRILNDTDASQIQPIRQQIRTSVRFSSPIAYLRSKKDGLSQEGLAEYVGVDPHTIQNWESGRSGVYRHSALAKLCELLNCTYKDIVTHTDEKLSERQPPNLPAKNKLDDTHTSLSIELPQECDTEKSTGGSKKESA